MSENLENLVKKAEELFELEKFQEIVELLTDEVLKKHKDARLYAWRGRAHYRLFHDSDLIMSYAESAISIDPNYFMGYIARGNGWNDKGDYDKAIADYTKAIELKPDYAFAYNNRGNSWNSKGEYDKAIVDYTRAIELNPDYALAYNNRGNSWNNKGEYDKAIADCTKAIELKPDYEDAYFNRGNSWDNKGEYDKAIADYTKAIELKPDDASVYINRGNSWNNKGEYDKAIADCTKAIELKPDYEDAYFNRGNSWNNKGEYDKAIADYTKAIEINPEYAYAYFNRGNSEKKHGINLDKCIEDFEQFLRLTPIKDDIWAIRAKDNIQELKEKIADIPLNEIDNITSKIKKILIVNNGNVTHYTTFSTTKVLAIEKGSKFRISEGAFLNDTSEGTELFELLQYKPTKIHSDGSTAEIYTPKPFIGSFVAEEKHDDLNLWRFYGKEEMTEAKGCSITIPIDSFTKEINDSLTEGHEKQDVNRESDISFYRVAYWNHDDKKIDLIVPNLPEKELHDLNHLMEELKQKVSSYEQDDKSILEKYLNNIAFLFKSDAYKNENEIRLIIKGIEFEKKFNESYTPPKVYIDLINIRHLIKHITLGPKIDKPEEWAAVIHYYFIKDRIDPPRITISRLPFK